MGKYNLILDGAEIDEITLNKHGDKIQISADNASIFERFANGYNNIGRMADEMSNKLDEIEKEYASKEDVNIPKAVSMSKVRTDFCKRAIEIIDDVFW